MSHSVTHWVSTFFLTYIAINITPIALLSMHKLIFVTIFSGYKTLVRFENSGSGINYFAWISFFSDLPKALGYSVANNITVLPVDSNVLCKL